MDLDTWIRAAADELGLPGEVPADDLLDLARVTAHGVARPAAPLSTFLVGLAAGRAGGSDADVAAAIATLRTLVNESS